MPQIPQKTQARTPGQVDLGREQDFDLPGISEQVLLKQFDKIAKNSGDLAKVFFARQDKKKGESDALAANSGLMEYYAANRQLENDLKQLNGADAEGMFIKMKNGSQRFYNSIVKNLTPDQKKIFDPEVISYDINVNTRVSVLEANKKSQWINDSYVAKSEAKMIQAQDNAGTNPQSFYQNLEESLSLEAERLKLNGIPKEKIETQGRITKSTSVKSGVLLMAVNSLPAAELWYEKAVKDKELMPFDKIALRASLDKMKTKKDKIDLRVKAQSATDKLIATYGEDRKTLFSIIEKQTSGVFEDELKKEVNVRLKQISDQTAENQRAFLSQGKGIIDQAANATEARNLVDFVMSDPNATIATAKTLESYIDATFVTPAGKRQTNPAKYQDFYTLINENMQGTATRDRIIRDSDDLSARIRPFTSIADEKKLIDFWRNKGFLGGTAYNEILQSFLDFENINKKEFLSDKFFGVAPKVKYQKYLDYVVPRLPPDKALNDFDLRKLGSDFYLLKEGEVFVPDAPFTSAGFDEFEDMNYEEAKEKGLELVWLPGELKGNALNQAKQLLAQENAERKSLGKSAIKENDIILRELYKEQVMRFKHSRITR